MASINLRQIFPVLFLFTVWITLISTTPSHAIDNIQKIKVGKNPTRVAIIPSRSEVYVSNRGDGTVSVINTTNNQLVSEPILVQGEPDALVVSKDGKTAYVGNHQGYVSVIDVEKRRVTKKIDTDGPVRGMDITPDGQKIYLALEWAGLYKLMTEDLSVTRIDRDPCPEAVAFTRDGTRAYVNYQCAPYPGSQGHDPIRIFDAKKDQWDKEDNKKDEEKDYSIFRYKTGKFTGKRIPNVGLANSLTVSHDGSRIWANGADACSRRATLSDQGGYDFEGCPEPQPNEDVRGRGIINIINIAADEIETKVFRDPRSGENIPLGAAVASFFPDDTRAAISTANRILILDTKSLELVGEPLAIPEAGNLVFIRGENRAYVPSARDNAVYSVQFGVESVPTWVDKATRWYGALWDKSFGQTLAGHLFLVALLWAVWSVGFASAFFAQVPGLRLPLELDIYLRGAKSKFVKLYLRQLETDIRERRQKGGVRSVVSLPIKRQGRRATTEEWLQDILKTAALGGHYRAALIGVGGTGKTFLLEEAMLQLIRHGSIPLFFRAVDYKSEASLDDWIRKALTASAVPIRPGLLRRIPSLVYVIDQATEVKLDAQEAFWQLIQSQFNPGIPATKLIVSGRSLTVQELAWDDHIEIAELQDIDIINLGAAYLDPSAQSEEIQSLPNTIRSIMSRPTAFIVSHYAKARTSSARPITNQRELYLEILDRHVTHSVLAIRPDVVKLVLERLVFKHYGATGNRGIPLNRHALSEDISGIFMELKLTELYGKDSVPEPAIFVDQFLVSGLVYPTQSCYLFFHDSFEDWLAEESQHRVQTA